MSHLFLCLILSIFSCPPGLQPNQVVDIDCECQNDHCMYNHRSQTGSTFGITSTFETSIDFRCSEIFDFYEDDILDKCINLPKVKNGEWICGENGTCALTYVEIDRRSGPLSGPKLTLSRKKFLEIFFFRPKNAFLVEIFNQKLAHNP